VENGMIKALFGSISHRVLNFGKEIKKGNIQG
jgi:hypothetical protein